MAILDSDFLAKYEQMAAAGGYDPVPPGEYTLQVTSAGTKATKDGSGLMVNVEFSIVGPSYQGRKIFERFNIRNRSAEAERIGISQLKGLAIAGGLQSGLRDTDELIGLTVLGQVAIEKDKSGRYDDQNKIKKYKPATMATMAAPASAPLPAAGGSFAAAFGDAAASPAQGGFKFN